MKKLLTATLLCGALLLAGCSGNTSAEINNNTITLPQADVSISFPESWEVHTTDETYRSMYDNNEYYQSYYGSVEEMKADFDELGVTYHSQAAASDNTIACILTSEDTTPQEGDEAVPLEEYARTVHDSTIFGYLSSGYKTGEDSRFEQTSYGGKTGYISYYELFAEDGEAFNFGFAEFMFDVEQQRYCIEIYYLTPEAKESAFAILDSITEI